MAWFRRALCLLWTWVLAGSFVLCFATPSRVIALTQASLNADMLKMAAALPAGTRAYERHVTGLDRWLTSIQRGAVLSKKV